MLLNIFKFTIYARGKMILSVIQSFHGDLHHLLGFVKNEKRDLLRRKSATLAVRRLLRGRVQGCYDLGAVWHILLSF